MKRLLRRSNPYNVKSIIQNNKKVHKLLKWPPSLRVSPHYRHADNGGNKKGGLALLRLCLRFILLVILILNLVGSSVGQAGGPPVDGPSVWQSKVDEWVLEAAASGETEFIVFLAEQADLSGAEALPTKLDKGRFVYQKLVETAQRAQPAVLQALETQGVAYRPYWVANMVWVRGGQQTLSILAQRTDVAHIFANPAVQAGLEEVGVASSSTASRWPPRNDTATPTNIEWNLTLVGAPQVWQAGYIGQGVVIGGQDTGYDWEHPALKNQYRGWDGSAADHNYSWHDAIHMLDPHNLIPSNPCGLDSQVPCDDNNHGTHTMGIMVGDDGAANQIGMAPGARWIGCRDMERGWGKPSTYAECYQWFIAPTDLNNQNSDPAMAPDVINNSWSCPPDEGCTDPTMLETVVHNLTTAGILSVHAAGNSGPACETINTAAAIYSDSFTVANTTSADALASSSSRGPVTVDGSGRRKPDIAAPGTGVRSSLPGGGYGYKTGTSMAAPHVAGLAALLISARPELAGQVSYLRQIIEQTSNPNVSVPNLPDSCGGYPYTTVPNNHFGWGRIQAVQAIDAALVQVVKQAPATAIVGEVITYTLTLTNLDPSHTFHNVVLEDILLTTGTQFVRASVPYTYSAGKLFWEWTTLNPGENQQTWVAVQLPASPSIVTNQEYSWRSDEFGPIYGEPVQTIVQYPWRYIFPLILKDWTQ